MRFFLILTLSVPIWLSVGEGLAAPDPRQCERQARDYANLMAPRTGAPALKQPPGLPLPNQRDERPEAMRMVPHQDAYRRAYEACMARP